MLRNDAYWFARLGIFLERADNTARILDVKYHVLLPENVEVGGGLDYSQWAAILRAVSALTAYHHVYHESLKPLLIADLMLLNDKMPRSLASCYRAICANLDSLAEAYGKQGEAQRLARGMRNRLENCADRADLRIRPARILRNRHQGQRPPRRGHRRAIPGLGIPFMRIAIQHRTHYAYASPAKSVMQLLRLTPRNHDGQTVKRWRIDLNCDGTLKAGEDPYGNLTHTLALAGPISDLEITVEGEVETEDRHGIVRGSYERFPGRALSARDAADRGRCGAEGIRARRDVRGEQGPAGAAALPAGRHLQHGQVRHHADQHRDAGDRSPSS